MRNLSELKDCFEEAIRLEAKFIGVLVTMPGVDCPELIINPTENFEYKLAYYSRAYTESLTLKTCKDILIITCAYGNSLEEVNAKLTDKCLEEVKGWLNL